MYDLNLLNERFENTKNQLDRADEIFSTIEFDSLSLKENESESLQRIEDQTDEDVISL